MNICVYGASSSAIAKEYTDEAFALGAEMAARGHGLVFGGGDKGLMGAVARGVTSQNGSVIGVAPSFFNVDGVLYEKCTELIMTETMRERKQKMEDLSEAFVMLPGGIGTFEEFFEIYTTKQLGRHTKAIAVLNTNGYYSKMAEMLSLAVDEKFMIRESLDLVQIFDDPKDVVDYIDSYIPPKAAFYK